MTTVQINAQSIQISGTVKEQGTGELLFGANIIVQNTSIGTTSNAYGYYTLSVVTDTTVRLVFSYLGYQSRTITLVPDAKYKKIDVSLSPNASELQVVEVTASKYEVAASRKVQMSTHRLPIKMVKELPAILGEKDPLKALQLLPGVQQSKEGFGNLYVRGGGADQNLFVLDGAPVYNVYHLFGFFSVFNSDVIRSMDFIKGGFPARYGGRLSSVVDIRTKEGRKDRLGVEGGIGLLISRLTLEAPIKKDKASFLLSMRRTYLDAFAGLFSAKNEKRPIYFYDGNLKLNWDISPADRLYLSGYFGKDNFGFKSKENDFLTVNDGFNWGNQTGTLRWNHLFGEKLFSNLTAIYTGYKFSVYSEEIERDSSYFLSFYSGIQDLGLKLDMDYFPSNNHRIRAGTFVQNHTFVTSALVLKNTRLNQDEVQKSPVKATEFALYFEDEWNPTGKLHVNGGLRWAGFGVQSRFYGGIEPRLSLAYFLEHDWAIKASYAQTNQYIHLLSNSGTGMPTDLWIPSDSLLLPQSARQVALGLDKDWEAGEVEFHINMEGYYKQLNDLPGYKEGASFLVLDVGPDPAKIKQNDIHKNLTTGNGRAIGLEFLFEMKTKRLQSWLSYTIAKSEVRLDGVNNGAYYATDYDKRHQLSIVATYELSPNITLSGLWTFSTGAPLTLPINNYYATSHFNFNNRQGTLIQSVSNRNAYRFPNYHRLDLSLQWKRHPKWGEAYWEFSVYNAYSRRNAFYFKTGRSRSNPQKRALYKVALFPVIPSISYNFKF